VEHALLALKGPSNIEKKVRELQSSLYRQVGLISALALPVMIPLCFVEPGSLPANRSELRDSLRRAAGREAPYLNSGSVAESAGYLFWDLTPRRELQRLRRSCEKVFAPEVGGQADQPAARQGVRQQDPFPVARGFFLCSLQGRSRDTIPSLTLSEPLRFPATALLLLRFHPLGVEPVTTEPRPSPTDARPWWKSLFWEKLEEIPLRKSATAG
jgi:hypothetical protein